MLAWPINLPQMLPYHYLTNLPYLAITVIFRREFQLIFAAFAKAKKVVEYSEVEPTRSN